MEDGYIAITGLFVKNGRLLSSYKFIDYLVGDPENLVSSYIYQFYEINEKPKKYEAYKLRGDAYYALRRYDLAQKDYQSAIDIKSSGDKFMTNTKYVSAIILGADKNEQLQNTELGNLYGSLMYAQKAQNDPAYISSYENAVKYNSHIYLPQPNKYEINRINCLKFNTFIKWFAVII